MISKSPEMAADRLCRWFWRLIAEGVAETDKLVFELENRVSIGEDIFKSDKSSKQQHNNQGKDFIKE